MSGKIMQNAMIFSCNSYQFILLFEAFRMVVCRI